MAQIFQYSRNRTTTVEADDTGGFVATCRLVDTLMELEVSLSVTMPDLEIGRALATVKRFEPKPELSLEPFLKRLVGARIGSGLFKIIAGVAGDDPHLAEPAYMVEECCQAVILALTKGQLAKSPREPVDSLPFLSEMVKKNPRLAGRCIAFAPGSAFMPARGEKEGGDA